MLNEEVERIAPEPRGFVEWDYEPDEFDREAEEDFDCHMGPDGYCGAAGSEDCEFECPYRREMR